jgi:hypothetical protein
MRVLQLTKKVPFPSKDGESMAIRSLASSLVSNGVSIDLLSLNTNKHRFSGAFNELDSTLYKSSQEILHKRAIEERVKANLIRWNNAMMPQEY